MSEHEPGDRPRPGSRSLERPPGERYLGSSPDGRNGPLAEVPGAGGGRSVARPLGGALVVGAAGALLLVVVGGIASLTSGLLFIAGIAGAAIGLLLAEVAVEDPTGAGPAWSRRATIRGAAAIGVAMVVVAAIGLWAVARAEGGALGPIDLVVQVYGPLLPLAAVIAAIAAAWGANAGPVRP